MVFIFRSRDNPRLDARGVFTPVGTENPITSQLRNQIYVGNGLTRVRSRLHEYADDPQELIGRAHTTSCTSSSKTVKNTNILQFLAIPFPYLVKRLCKIVVRTSRHVRCVVLRISVTRHAAITNVSTKVNMKNLGKVIVKRYTCANICCSLLSCF